MRLPVSPSSPLAVSAAVRSRARASVANDPRPSPSPAQNLSVRLTHTLRQQVHDAALASGVPVSSWLRHVVQHLTPQDFPTRWQPGAPPKEVWEDLARITQPSHDSRIYTRHFMIRVDEENGRMMYPRISSTDGNDFICKIDLTLLGPKDTLVAPAVRKGQRAKWCIR